MILAGTSLYPGDEATMRRQELAVRALSSLQSVEGLNLQFRDAAPTSLPGIETMALLTTDSNEVAGPGLRRKPVTRDVFDILSRTAAARGHQYFAFFNSDIVILPGAVDEVVRHSRETYAISRHDVDQLNGDHSCGAALLYGLDLFVVSVAWWQRARWRFRPYVVGEACWDNVYTALMMCHSNGVVLNRDPLILHERHPTSWNSNTPTARYNGFLAALDARYFSLWCDYCRLLEQARARGASEADELAIRKQVFVWRRSPVEAVRQTIRSARARVRFYWGQDRQERREGQEGAPAAMSPRGAQQPARMHQPKDALGVGPQRHRKK